MIDVAALTYSDAIRYREDYLSTNPIYNLTEDDFHRISDCFGMDTSSIQPTYKRFSL
jgi:hypothetical protein